MLRKLMLSGLVLLSFLAPASAHGDTRLIVRDTLGLSSLQLGCKLLGCNVVGGLDGALGQVFLITTPASNLTNFLGQLAKLAGITNIELDQSGKILQSSSSGIPPALSDSTPTNYYGTQVIHGYVGQPAVGIVRLVETQADFKVRGTGTVAVIDTGVDPDHPALKNVIVGGYDFTRNVGGPPSEESDVNQSTAAVLNNASPAIINQSTAAVLNQSTAAVLNDQNYVAFGHGTMVAGVIHLVAPGASILSLKAFKADGSGYLSDVLRAYYYAVQNNARVINMSFSFTSYSKELYQATVNGTKKGVISIASVGNEGRQTTVYPAGYDTVIGVASTSNGDARSTFSNYGPMVWVGAPGEGIITTYPWGTWAATWGTSFSAPFVSGATALLQDVASGNKAQAADALAQARKLTSDLGNGRIDLYNAVQAYRNAMGIR